MLRLAHAGVFMHCLPPRNPARLGPSRISFLCSHAPPFRLVDRSDWNIGSSKSTCAAEAAARINPAIRVKALQNRVSPETGGWSLPGGGLAGCVVSSVEGWGAAAAARPAAGCMSHRGVAQSAAAARPHQPSL